jgi:hypothetical protein
MKQFCVIGIDPTRYWTDGYGYWRDDENGQVYRDDILVTLTKEDAYWVAKDCGQICYVFVDTEPEKPNGYLVGAEEEELRKLFEAKQISGYTVFDRKPKDIPQVFTIVDSLEGLQELQGTVRPVFYEFVYVR